MPNWKPVFSEDFPAGPDIGRPKWELPVWTAENNKSFLGRTAFRNPENFDDPIGLVPCTAENGADLRFSTYNPKAPANDAFLGTAIYTQDKWGGGGEAVKFEAIVKSPAMPGGAVTSVFAYALCSPEERRVQNEIDFEFASNHSQAPNQELLTNVFVCSSDAGLGPGPSRTTANLQDWNTFSLIYTPSQSVEWQINGVSFLTDTQHVPDLTQSGGMHFYLNFWAPAPGWTWAYNENLQPTGGSDEQEWHYYVKKAAVYYAT